MDVDYGPALPPHLDSHDSRVDDASGQPFSAVEEPSRLPSTLTKKCSHYHKQYSVCPALPRTTTLNNPKTLDLPRAGLKSTLTNQNINPGPDIYLLLLQRRTSLLKLDIGLLNLQRGLIPIRIILNMT